MGLDFFLSLLFLSVFIPLLISTDDFILKTSVFKSTF